MTAWIGVASADHVARGREDGFMQVCHGKHTPIARVQPGDVVIYYSPVTTMGGSDKLQSFTAAGIVRPGEPYLVDMGDGFTPYRRDVDWRQTKVMPIGPLLDHLELTSGKINWGYGFRFGLVRISDRDCKLIIEAMTPAQIASE